MPDGLNTMKPGLILLLCASSALCQTPSPGPLVVDLPQALARARQYGGQVQSANLALAQATQDRVQARAATLPQISGLSQYIYTQGNGTPSGIFVSNDGVHVYNDQGIAHEDLTPVFLHGAQQRAAAAEAVARAKVDIAARGLNAVVIQNFYAVQDATRKIDNANRSLAEAQNFLDITQKLEAGGEAAHADVVKAESQLQQRQIDLSEAQTSSEKAKIALAVLIYPDYQTNFSVKDDLDQTDQIPPLPEVHAQAVATNPDVKAASLTVDQAGYDVAVARYGYLPTLSLDFFYGLNSNVFAWQRDENARNVGSVAQVTLNIPIFNWGATKSKVKQAQLRQDQARLDLSTTQRALEGAIAAAHAEAEGAFAQVSMLRQNVDLATESQRLALLRYQAGEATALEVSDAQSTVKTARDAYDDGLARYRIAIATLRTLMGQI
ncbi:MAG TPA: TolC family protein [Bryobacteraceae bacterium]|nr:TolC family protein [Bryobacteraceae bacterium]